ncbi:MAG: phage integrase N-terminal SAM-like domain-containing protein [Candidatus Hydrogenedentes bacterium]|nr:phage integrase N-terminal SAM-like domain-containing protein [Candidatus Hydrogenedentota bacterium]
MSNEIREQFVRDMQVAGFSEGTQTRYLSLVNGFFKEMWVEPGAVTERNVQDFFIFLRGKKVAKETFRGNRFALQFLFCNTLRRDWEFFKKN